MTKITLNAPNFSMKLLSGLQNKDNQQAEQTRKLLRAQEIQKLAEEADIKLARAEEEFNRTLARNRATWADEEVLHAERVKAMESEVKALEKRKEQALIPVSMYRLKVDEAMKEAQEYIKKAKEKDVQADYLQDKLEEKLVEVYDRENQMQAEEARLANLKRGVEAQQEQTREGVARLSEEMIMFHEKQTQDEAIMTERKNELSMAEINLNAREEKVKQNLEALKIFDKQLKDKEETMAREIVRRKR